MPNTFIKIAAVTVGSGGAANMTFTSIPQTYTDLIVKVSSRVSTSDTQISVRFNTSTTNWTWKRLYGDGSSATSQANTDSYWFYTDTAAQTANTFGSGEIYIPNYAGSTFKSVSSESITENNAAFAEAFMAAGLWSNTAAINEIALVPLTGTFVQHSTATLYGIKKD